MTYEEAIELIREELSRATTKFPEWPTDALHAAAVLGEEYGELTQAALQCAYEPHKSDPTDLRTEAIQTATMALRFLMSIDTYEHTTSMQHRQTPPPPLENKS